jgi:hypothetical protein
VIDPGLAEAEHTHDRVSENTDSTKIIVEPRIDDFIMSSQLHNLDDFISGGVCENTSNSINSKELNDIDVARIELHDNELIKLPNESSKERGSSREFKLHFAQFDSESFLIAADEFIKKVDPKLNNTPEVTQGKGNINTSEGSLNFKQEVNDLDLMNSKFSMSHSFEVQNTNVLRTADALLIPDILTEDIYEFQLRKRVTFQDPNEEFLFGNLKKHFETQNLSNYDKPKVKVEKEKSVAEIRDDFYVKMEKSIPVGSPKKDLKNMKGLDGCEEIEKIDKNLLVGDRIKGLDEEKEKASVGVIVKVPGDILVDKYESTQRILENLTLIDRSDSFDYVSKCVEDDDRLQQTLNSIATTTCSIKPKRTACNQEIEIQVADPFQNVYINTTTQKVTISFKFTPEQMISISKTPIKFEYRHGCGSCKVPIGFHKEEELVEGVEMEITGYMKCLCGREWKWRSFMEKERVLYFVVGGKRFELLIPYELCYLKK